jgi:predicted metal-dependent hydrolase
MKRTLQYGSKKIDYHLEFRERKTLKISVLPDMSVRVVAPKGSQRSRVDSILNKKAPWILKQQGYFLAFFPKQPPKQFVGGESHRYLGKQYRLKIYRGKKESVHLSGQFIHIVCNDRDRVKSLLKKWYEDRASVRFSLYADEWIEYFKRYDIQPKEIVVKEMPKRWGSCTPKGKIILNPELVKAPKGCIEYVIVHELCHLVHRNHSQKFIGLQTQAMSNWEQWKMRLEKMLA